MNPINHYQTPLFDALRRYADEGTISFHVPGHKHGEGIPEFTDYVGKKVMNIDLTILPDLDGIFNPTGVIKEAQDLTAAAYGADHAFFLVNGTTSGIQGMIMSVCSEGDEIIVPRNTHKSVTSGLILSGAKPVYIQPEIDPFLGIAKGVEPETVEQALREHPKAKAVFIINATYYGMASNLKRIVEIAHGYNVPVIVDEAHGPHFHFHPTLPLSAMEAGADMSAASVHKLMGSMTQSSVLLLREGYVFPRKVKSVLNLTQSTSPSYVLMASLDVSRKQMVLQGEAMLQRTLDLSERVRTELNQLPGIYVYGQEMVGTPGCYAYDPTKIAINVRELGLTGFEAETFLRERHHLAFELSDFYNLLAIVAIGDSDQTIDRLITGIKDLAANRVADAHLTQPIRTLETPELVTLPRDAFYSETRSVALEDAEGEVSAEIVMAYPPGIPMICPGERVTRDLIDLIQALKHENCRLQGPEDPGIDYLRVIARNVYAVPAGRVVGYRG